MSKSKTKSRHPASGAAGATGAAEGSTGDKPNKPGQPANAPDGGFREMIESVVIACILAFLFRTFVSEAFVIPTGSMAPTLYGRHKEVTCPECQYFFAIGASEELSQDDEREILTSRIRHATCPNCRYLIDAYNANVFRGDRILVNKFPYEIGEPERWDVFVFRFPEDPQKNYIKRLVGLPGEAVQIRRGDLYTRTGTQGRFEIRRKADPEKQRVLQQLVYDDQHPPQRLIAAGWPERWAPMEPGSTAALGNRDWQDSPSSSWKRLTEPRGLSTTATSELSWVRYRHYIPSQIDWRVASETREIKSSPAPQLVSDFCAYNAVDENASLDRFWVGDLTVGAHVDLGPVSAAPTTDGRPGAELVLELNEGVRRYCCRFDVVTGEAVFTRTNELQGDGSEETELARIQTPLRAGKSHDLLFANVDDRLLLWIDGVSQPIGAAGEYPAPANPNPQPDDLRPVGIGARGVSVALSRLLVQRDVYYIADAADPLGNFDSQEDDSRTIDGDLRRVLDNPVAWGDLYSRRDRAVTFDPLDQNEFFAMGDNSQRSQDSRLWSNRRRATHRHAVERHALLGKAFFVYWPHGVPFGNGGQGWPVMSHRVPSDLQIENYPLVTVPFYPYVSRMQRIR